MLLAIDVGNTDTKFGLLADDQWLAVWRRPTPLVTGPETGVWLQEQAAEAGLELKPSLIGCASVVPAASEVISELFGSSVSFVSATSKLPFRIEYEHPEKLGADRIANVLGAVKEQSPPMIIIDIGTATTFEAVNAEGVFVGGAIMPGPELLSTALTQHTAQLPPVEIQEPRAFIGNSTVRSLQSGIVYGFVGALEKIVQGIKTELGGNATVIMTGGRAQHFLGLTSLGEQYLPRLTLRGIAEYAQL